eukprot:TRINITY_DN405_c0_g1_i1.p1 TRINITY_DN405_c0_g1~~TRINITY_DN405_c0_g1_i1.p1  ORF type:complete len:283 (+),score=90.10 TRINITY_DN405_c0_g1_i1:77-925(+)
MAPAKTVIALLLSMQGVHAVRTDAEIALHLEGVSSAEAQLQQVLEKLKGSPCEYAVAHEIKTLGINIAGGVNALEEIQAKINDLAKNCHRITKAESQIEKLDGLLTVINQRVPATTESISKANGEISGWKSQHVEINDETCKAAYAKTGIGGKTKRALSSVTRSVSNFFGDFRKSKEEKEALKRERAKAKADAAAQLESATTISAKCKELEGLVSNLNKLQKSLDKDATDKVKYEGELEKQKAELEEAKAGEDGAVTAAVEMAKKISDDLKVNLGSASPDAQ